MMVDFIEVNVAKSKGGGRYWLRTKGIRYIRQMEVGAQISILGSSYDTTDFLVVETPEELLAQMTGIGPDFTNLEVCEAGSEDFE